MSEAKFESVMRELRATARPAPDRLRERVGALREPETRSAVRLRPALVAAVATAVAVGLGAAAIGGLRGSGNAKRTNAAGAQTERAVPSSIQGSLHRNLPAPKSAAFRPILDGTRLSAQGAPFSLSPDRAFGGRVLTPGARLQRYDVAMRLRVKNLSRSTQAAVRHTRRLGGYVAAADYAIGGNVGDSRLELRVPVGRLQSAIARFTDLGTILSQHIAVADLKAPLDRTDARIAQLHKVIAELEAKSFLTPAEQTKLDGAKRTVQRLSQRRSSLIRQGTFARLSLQLTTRKAAAQHSQPGRFDRFWGDAGDILGKEAIAVLYALVVIGPFAILALLAFLAERTRRRRADHRLLEETG
jgi:hypothetical protein